MQKRNPFEQTQASVGNAQRSPGSPMAMPGTVDRAFKSLLGSAFLGLFSYVVRGMVEPPGWTAIGLASVVGFAFLIRAGQHWARIVLMVFVVLGAVGIVLTSAALPGKGASYVVITLGIVLISGALAGNGAFHVVTMVMQILLQVYAAWLVFRPPSSRWFKPYRRLESWPEPDEPLLPSRAGARSPGSP